MPVTKSTESYIVKSGIIKGQIEDSNLFIQSTTRLMTGTLPIFRGSYWAVFRVGLKKPGGAHCRYRWQALPCGEKKTRPVTPAVRVLFKSLDTLHTSRHLEFGHDPRDASPTRILGFDQRGSQVDGHDHHTRLVLLLCGSASLRQSFMPALIINAKALRRRDAKVQALFGYFIRFFSLLL
jgi:hypothetical protein